MANFNSGDSVAVSLGPNDSVAISGSAQIVMLDSDGSNIVSNVTGNSTFGPFQIATTLTINAVSGGSYTVTTDPELAAHAAQHAGMGVVSPTRVDSSRWPMVLPTIMGSPPTIARGAANGSTQISGSVLTPADRPGAFRYIGGPARRTTTNPDFTGLSLGKYPQITTQAPTAVEFSLYTTDSTGRFELYHKGSGGSYRLLARQNGGTWSAVAATGTALPSDGNLYLELVTLGAAGLWEIRVEYYFGVFFGVRATPTSSIRATKKPTRRIIVAGDSFTEPTITDSGSSWAFDGWVQQLGYLTGWDFWSAGSGGTGWLQTNGSRPKMRDRLANDILAFPSDEYWFALGINDISQSTSAVAAEVAATIAATRAAYPGAVIRVFSPFWKSGYKNYDVRLLGLRDAIKGAAVGMNVGFLDVLDYGAPSWLSDVPAFATTLTAPLGASDASITVAALPAYFSNSAATAPSGDWYVCIGSGANQVVRKINGWGSGSAGAFVLPIDSTVGQSFAAGTPVKACGPGWLSGTGNQGAPAGDGNADLNVGSDLTHPTKRGHADLAVVSTSLLSVTS